MFLLPLHIRSVLQSLLSEGRGPHTALLLLAQGQVLCQATTSDADWEPQSEGEEEEEDDEEPYMATPERNRLLRGLAKSQWAEQEVEGGHGAVKVECEVRQEEFRERVITKQLPVARQAPSLPCFHPTQSRRNVFFSSFPTSHSPSSNVHASVVGEWRGGRRAADGGQVVVGAERSQEHQLGEDGEQGEPPAL